mgnify:FL=1
MLDLEVVPERSLGNEQWEFILGKFGCQRSTLISQPTIDVNNRKLNEITHRHWKCQVMNVYVVSGASYKKNYIQLFIYMVKGEGRIHETADTCNIMLQDKVKNTQPID